jgi:hypothetical protein
MTKKIKKKDKPYYVVQKAKRGDCEEIQDLLNAAKRKGYEFIQAVPQFKTNDFNRCIPDGTLCIFVNKSKRDQEKALGIDLGPSIFG